MKKYNELEKAAEEALNSLNNLQQVEANEYLHSKIMLRMQNKNTPPPAYNRLMLRLAAVLLLFVCLNGVSYYVLKQNTATSQPKQITGKEGFAEAYGLNSSMENY